MSSGILFFVRLAESCRRGTFHPSKPFPNHRTNKGIFLYLRFAIWRFGNNMGFKQALRLNTLRVLLLPILLGLFAGCVSKSRNVLYKLPNKIDTKDIPVVHLNRDTTEDIVNYQHKIQRDDKLGVRFLNNTDITGGITLTGNNSATQDIVFLVDQQGNVKLPMVGKINVLDSTKNQAANKIEEAYRRDFINPNIEVKLVGLSVSVEGEVRSPGVYPLPREKTTLVEIIAAAGGMTPYSKKGKVKVIRRKPGKPEPEVLIFNLSVIESLEQPELYLRDKDIIYVEPRDIRIIGETISPYTTFISLVSTLGTISVVVLNLSRR